MKARRSISTMELTEQDIPLMKGRAYDITGHNFIYRALEDWYLTKSDSTLPIRINLEDATHPGVYTLRGMLVTQQEGVDNIPVRINFDGRWSVDRDNELRGIWAQTDRAWYWLKRPCSRQITYPVHVTVDGIQQTNDHSCIVVTYPSQDELHLELRAKLGLVSNLCDLFLFDETPDSFALLTRHANQTPDALHKELTPSPQLLAKFPDRSPEPFDLQLLKRHATFIKNHFLGFHPQFPPKCAFATALKQTVTAREWTRDELLASALAAERRGGRYPWGELLHDDNAPTRRVNPNWVYAERLQEAADEVNHKRESKTVKTENGDETLLPRLKKKRVDAKLEVPGVSEVSTNKTLSTLPPLKKRTTPGSELDTAVEGTPKRADKRRISDLVDTDDEEIVNQEERSEKSVNNATSTSSPRRAKKLQRDVKGSLAPLKRTTKNGDGAVESSGKRADKLRVSALMDTDDEEVVNQESTLSSSPRKAKNLKRDIKESPTPLKRTTKDAGFENSDGKSKSQTKVEDANHKEGVIGEEKRASEHRLSMILTETTFQPLRMKDALDDMRPYLNKEVCECETMADLRAAGYAFKSNESAEQFIVAKMRTSVTSWEYKVLVALVLTNIYEQPLATEVITKFEKTLFGKGKAKNQEPLVKIFCKRWSSQAVALFAKFEEASKSANSSMPSSHPLRTSLLSELFLEFCKFSAKCRVLKSKAALDTIKDPARYGIDFMQALEKISEITSKLKLASLSIECNSARGRFLAMMDDRSKATAQVEKGKNNANSGEQPSAAAASSSTEQLPPPSTINYQKAGQKLRMRAMHQRLVSACTTASQENPPGRSAPPTQLNSTWGGKSAWGFPTDTENTPVEQDESLDSGHSINAWAASSTRVRFGIWGSAGDRAPSQGLNSFELKTSVTPPLLSSVVDAVGTTAITPADQIANAIFQAASSATKLPQQGQVVMGVGNGKDHQIPGNGRGRGAHLNRPAWQTTSENFGLREHVVTSPPASNVERPVQPHPVQPLRSDRRGPGLGRGSHVNKPAWMTSQGNDVGIPSRQPNDSQEQSVAVQVAAPTAFSETRVNPTLGRGRGRAMTMPAWMTNQEPNRNP